MKKYLIPALFFTLIQQSFGQYFINQTTINSTISIDYPKSINNPSGVSGSGFLLQDSAFIYIVSAKHMFFRQNSSGGFTDKLIDSTLLLTTYSGSLTDDRINYLDVDLKTLYEHECIIYDSLNDFAAVIIGIARPGGHLVDYLSPVGKNHKTKGITPMAQSEIGSFDQVETGADVFIFGYPKSIGLGAGQFELNKPLAMKGIIAGENYKKRTFIINAQVYHGNSGGPVFCFVPITRDFKLVGVVSELVPYESVVYKNGKIIDSTGVLNNTNFSIVTPIDQLLTLIHKFEATKIIREPIADPKLKK